MGNVDEAFEKFSRTDFLPASKKSFANIDAPIPIGFGQTNSQPSTVYEMLEWLDPQPGDTVLDVGSGSGWTTALLSYLVGAEGTVHAVEKLPELLKFGANNCKVAGITNAQFHTTGKALGLPELGPYDRILVSASADRLPTELLEQLKLNGRMVIPVVDEIQVIDRVGKDKYETILHSGYVFVPLVK